MGERVCRVGEREEEAERFFYFVSKSVVCITICCSKYVICCGGAICKLEVSSQPSTLSRKASTHPVHSGRFDTFVGEGGCSFPADSDRGWPSRVPSSRTLGS